MQKRFFTCPRCKSHEAPELVDQSGHQVQCVCGLISSLRVFNTAEQEEELADFQNDQAKDDERAPA